MIEKVLNRKNMRLACSQVLRNKGSAGVDGMNVNQLHCYATEHRDELALRILKGEYLPQPIKGEPFPRVMERSAC